MSTHLNRIESARDLAITESQATPKTTFPATRDQSRCCAGSQALVVSVIPRDITATRTRQTRDTFFLAAHINI
jgi:hypothetical protein